MAVGGVWTHEWQLVLCVNGSWWVWTREWQLVLEMYELQLVGLDA